MLTLPLTDDAELCDMEPWQAEELAAFIDKHRAHLAPWLPWATNITDTAGARRWIQHYADGRAADGPRMYGIRVGGELAGGTVFRIFDTAAGVCELGVWLAPWAEGRGLVTRATRHMIHWAVDVRGMSRVEWRAMPDNRRSTAVAERLGMTREGTLRSQFSLNGVRQDIEVWALVAEH